MQQARKMSRAKWARGNLQTRKKRPWGRFLSQHKASLSKLNSKNIKCVRLTWNAKAFTTYGLLRKEVIQPQVPLRLPCYDFTPVTDHSLGGCLREVSAPTSGAIDSHGVTGGVYKARERIHRGMLIHDY